MASYKILYVAGIGRNGGTILDRILGHVPGFVSTGELRFVWLKGVLGNELCNCGRSFRECPFWTEVGQRAFGGWTTPFAEEMRAASERADPSRHVASWLLPTSAFRTRVAPYVEALGRLHDAVAEVSHARVVVNSSKFAGYGFGLIASARAPVYVLHLVRDPRATAYSWSKVVRKPEVPEGEAFLRRFGTLSAALQWNYRNLAAEWLRARAAAYLRLDYRLFASSPRAVVAGLAEWIGEPSESLPFDGESIARLGDCHVQSGNPSRFRTGAVPIEPDEEWRRRMPFGAKAAVTALTWPVALRYRAFG